MFDSNTLRLRDVHTATGPDDWQHMAAKALASAMRHHRRFCLQVHVPVCRCTANERQLAALHRALPQQLEVRQD
jgi:hypothetical protein